MEKIAVVLLSGGLDSTTCLVLAKSQRFDIVALTVNYGQRHCIEVEKAKEIGKKYGIAKHIVLDLDLSLWGGSALVGKGAVPKQRAASKMTSEIPTTYVPARNTIFLSLALALAEAMQACDIFIGVNALDYSGYPDCRPLFIEAFESLANIATKSSTQGVKFTIHAPLLHKTKAEIITLGKELGVDFGLTLSCYDPAPNGKPCNMCDSCRLREKGFREAGLSDPIRTQS